MEFDQQLSKAEFISAMRIYTREFSKMGKRGIKLFKLFSIISFVIFLGVFTMITFNFMRLHNELFYYSFGLFFKSFFFANYMLILALFLALAVGIYMLFTFITFPDRHSRKWSEDIDNSRLFAKRLYTIDEYGITIKSKENNDFFGFFSWKNMEKLYETKEFLILEVSSNKIEILLKNQIGNTKEIEIKKNYQKNRDN